MPAIRCRDRSWLALLALDSSPGPCWLKPPDCHPNTNALCLLFAQLWLKYDGSWVWAGGLELCFSTWGISTHPLYNGADSAKTSGVLFLLLQLCPLVLSMCSGHLQTCHNDEKLYQSIKISADLNSCPSTEMTGTAGVMWGFKKQSV